MNVPSLDAREGIFPCRRPCRRVPVTFMPAQFLVGIDQVRGLFGGVSRSTAYKLLACYGVDGRCGRYNVYAVDAAVRREANYKTLKADKRKGSL